MHVLVQALALLTVVIMLLVAVGLGQLQFAVVRSPISDYLAGRSTDGGVGRMC